MKQTRTNQIQRKRRSGPAIAPVLPTADELNGYDDFDGYVRLLHAALRERHTGVRADLESDLNRFLAEASERELFFMSYALSIWNGQRNFERQAGEPVELAHAFELAAGDVAAIAGKEEQPANEVRAHMTADGVTLELTARRTPKCRAMRAQAAQA